jgi:hypothetical protein
MRPVFLVQEKQTHGVGEVAYCKNTNHDKGTTTGLDQAGAARTPSFQSSEPVRDESEQDCSPLRSILAHNTQQGTTPGDVLECTHAEKGYC